MIIFNSRTLLSLIGLYFSDSPTIIEVGSFDGNDTVKMARKWPNGTIYAFEPVNDIYEKLEKNTQDFGNVHCYNMAVSDKNGYALFYIAEKISKKGVTSQASSLRKPKERLLVSPIIFPRTTQVRTITMNVWMEENGITSIDLLWLDTQGHELTILKSMQHRLHEVRVLFAEVSFIESYEGQELYTEVIAWIEAHGFVAIGKDFEFPGSDSFFGNILFVRQDLV